MTSKVIIVTGASRGIGRAIALKLLKDSHKVVVVSRSESELKSIHDKFPSQVEYLAVDMTLDDSAPRLTQLALDKFGKLDGVVINHGALSPMTRLADSSVQEWKNLYEANFFSALALVKETIPHLRATNGRAIFVSSGAAQNAYTSWGAYGSSKAALNSLARHLAVEEQNIVSVAVSPGRVDTDMQRELRERGAPGIAMSEQDYAGFKSAFEEGKLNKPEWPGDVIAKLVVEAKSDLSGKYFSWNASELAEYRDGQ